MPAPAGARVGQQAGWRRTKTAGTAKRGLAWAPCCRCCVAKQDKQAEEQAWLQLAGSAHGAFGSGRGKGTNALVGRSESAQLRAGNFDVWLFPNLFALGQIGDSAALGGQPEHWRLPLPGERFVTARPTVRPR